MLYYVVWFFLLWGVLRFLRLIIRFIPRNVRKLWGMFRLRFPVK